MRLSERTSPSPTWRIIYRTIIAIQCETVLVGVALRYRHTSELIEYKNTTCFLVLLTDVISTVYSKRSNSNKMQWLPMRTIRFGYCPDYVTANTFFSRFICLRCRALPRAMREIIKADALFYVNQKRKIRIYVAVAHYRCRAITTRRLFIN